MNPFSEPVFLRPAFAETLPLRLASEAVHAGFPSPAIGYEEGTLDLSRYFVRHPSSTFIVRVAGDSLCGIGINPGDYLVVDRSRDARSGDVVLAIIDGDFAAKRYVVQHGGIVLAAENPRYAAIAWHDGCEIWGVVTSVHRDLQQGIK
jgi:DNA polymerase V